MVPRIVLCDEDLALIYAYLATHSSGGHPTPWCTFLLEKLIVAPLVKKFSTFYEFEASLPCSQESASGPYPEPDVSSPYPLTNPLTPFSYDPFLCHLPIYAYVFRVGSSHHVFR